MTRLHLRRAEPGRAPTLLSVLALVVVGALLLAGCGSDGGSSAAPEEGSDTTAADAAEAGWSYTDDQGETITLDEAPQVIVAESMAAGALWEYGIEVDGVFGPQRRSDGSTDPALGMADPDAFESLGEVYGEVNLEKLAALQPDLIITTTWDDTGYWGIGEEIQEEVEAIAPVAAVRVDHQTIDEPLARMQELAAAIGGDYDEQKAADARQAFEDASAELEAAAAENPGVTILPASGSTDIFYVAVPEGYPDLSYYQSLGVDIVEPDTDEEYWEELSWEQVGKYPTDVLLADSRGGDLEQIKAFLPASAQALPAVQADQLDLWQAVSAMGYGNWALVLEDLAEVVRSADASVAP